MNKVLIPPDESGLLQAALLIRDGKLVAFPTETVYGLGANALSVDAVRSIFVAKGRPLTDPLIVHVSCTEQALDLVELDEKERELFHLLASAFWPGPLTVIVRASVRIPALVTAHTGFVGIRVPNHPIALRLIELSQLPIAAPSANRFGHVSPTSASHVIADLGEKAYILNGECGGALAEDKNATCRFGIESTVVKLDSHSSELRIYRQGAVTQTLIEDAAALFLRRNNWEVVNVNRAVVMHSGSSATNSSPEADLKEASRGDDGPYLCEGRDSGGTGSGQEAPGQAVTHYAPDIPCFIVQSMLLYGMMRCTMIGPAADARTVLLSRTQLLEEVVVIDYGNALSALDGMTLAYRDLSVQKNAQEAARRLFDTLRWSEGVPGARMVLLASVLSSRADTVTHQPSVLHYDGDYDGKYDLTLGLMDRIFRAASGTSIHLEVVS